MIKRSIPLTSQPQYPVEVNHGNLLGRTITHCIPLNGINREIVTGAELTLGSGASQIVDVRGRSLQGSGSAACASVPINLNPYTKVSLSFWMYWNAFANDDDLAMEYGSNYVTNQGILIDPNGSTSGKFDVGVGSPGASNAQSFVRPSAAAWHHYVINLDRTTGTADACTVFVDGVAQSLVDVGVQSNVSDSFSNSSLYILSRNNASLFGAGRLQNIVIRGEYLVSAVEAQEEYKNPWQIYKPLKRVLYSSAASGITGTGALTTTVTTASGTGSVAHTGTGAATVGAVTASGTGVLGHTGTGAPTTTATTASGTGTVTGAGVVTGTGAIAVGAVTASGAGTLAHTGTGAVTVGTVTASGTGKLTHTGTGAITIGNITVSGSGSLGVGVTGTGAITIGNVTVSGTGTRIGWDLAASASGSWSAASSASDVWTDQTPAIGSWTVQ